MSNGKKICFTGSKLGLYWPRGVVMGTSNALYICEGESDTAALLSLGFDAIGRPSCSAGTDDILGLLRGHDKHVVIMTDKDDWKIRPDGKKYKPGQDGAYRLAKEIKPIVKSLKVVRPSKYKDIRKWLINGATHAAVQCVVDNTRFI
jgi:5S rRNA maturation endonuclease (ribonuclease M5)